MQVISFTTGESQFSGYHTSFIVRDMPEKYCLYTKKQLMIQRSIPLLNICSLKHYLGSCQEIRIFWSKAISSQSSRIDSTVQLQQQEV